MGKRLSPSKRKKAKERIITNKRDKWWQRKGTKSRGFRYVDVDGKKITNEKHLERIKNLVIPPAWKYVRISPSSRSNLQAVGMDTAGRVQYLYSEKYRAKQEKKKYEKIERFGEHLPNLRKITNKHLELEGFPREKILALMTRLINQLYIRMGSPKSVKKYRTFGITTLQHKHLEIKSNGKLVFNFVGKHSIKQRKVMVDKDLAKLMKQLKELKGKRKLFKYVGEDGKTYSIKARDVNKYLKELTAPEFSAKDFRTWGGTLLAALELAEIGCCDDEKVLKKNIVKAVKKVAKQLGNTPSVCRSSYIHPAIIDSYQKGVTLEEFIPKKKRKVKKIKAEFEPEEAALIKLFQTNE